MSTTLRCIYRAPQDFSAEHRVGEPWEKFAAAARERVTTHEPIVAATDWEPVFPVTRATMFRVNESTGRVEELSVSVSMTFAPWSGADTERVVNALRDKLNQWP